MLQKASFFAGFLMATALSATIASASPITYSGVLYDGVTVTNDIPTTGAADSPGSNVSDYWLFTGNLGDLVSITGSRLEGAFDMTFWVFQGVFTDDSVFGTQLDPTDAGFLAFADDELPPTIPGPFGDPFVAALPLPATGQYTVIVTNFLSGTDGGDGLFPYTLTATGVAPVPVPAALPMLALGLGALGVFARRNRRAA